MKIIKSATKTDKSTIISVNDSELKLFEMQKTRRVKSIVEKSIKPMVEVNAELVTAIKFATNFYNTAYRSQIECTYTTALIKPKITVVKTKKGK